MRKPVNEIEKVLQTHSYSINNIICDVMKKFNFKSLIHQVGFRKQEGYSTFEIISLMLMFPLMLLKSVNSLFNSEFQKVTEMKKDSIYRLKNNEKLPWRSVIAYKMSLNQSGLINTLYLPALENTHIGMTALM